VNYRSLKMGFVNRCRRKIKTSQFSDNVWLHYV